VPLTTRFGILGIKLPVAKLTEPENQTFLVRGPHVFVQRTN